MAKYIHELKAWPNFRWDHDQLGQRLAEVSLRQGRLLGQMEALGFDLRNEAQLRTVTEEVIKSTEIEGEILAADQVRSSVARHLGMGIGALTPPDRYVEGVVEMTLDATQGFEQSLTPQRLFDWHAALFPTGRSGMKRIIVGAWRDDREMPMQVVSGPLGKERIHYEAPSSDRLKNEMDQFLDWFNNADPPTALKAGIAHLWFVTIHPFFDGNGRITRAITDMVLARCEKSPRRFYSMSAQIRQERKAYYEILEKTQRGDLDLSEWLDWFLGCLERAFGGAKIVLSTVLEKARFWEKHAQQTLNERQRTILNLLLTGFEGKLTSSKWAKLCECSQDTASRDINDLLARGILVKDVSGGRSTSYSLAEF